MSSYDIATTEIEELKFMYIAICLIQIFT